MAGLWLCAGATVCGQERRPEVHGTLRCKYEYQTDMGEGRFEVRNARVSLTGNVIDAVSYKAEIDLSDEGVIKMLDAYTRIVPFEGFSLTIGQMRVPFTIDAHRSPHLQYFANRSFIAKQVGNVRDVGATAAYTFNAGFPVVVEAGLFNGSGLTEQKDYWTSGTNFSMKAQLLLPRGLNVTLSAQKIKPSDVSVMMYDAGAYYHTDRWHAEAEYLYKRYADDAYPAVHAFDAFVSRDLPVRGRRSMIKTVSPLVRFDYMSDHSDGVRHFDGPEDEAGYLVTTDCRRSRVTGGVTLRLAAPFVSDIRLNYEKYFYRDGAVIKPSEHDKIVLEVMTRF